MKNFFITVMVIGLTLTSITAFAQSAKDAVLGLKELNARCEAGISLRDYAPALGKAKFQVNQFLENKDEMERY